MKVNLTAKNPFLKQASKNKKEGIEHHPRLWIFYPPACRVSRGRIKK